MGVPANMPQPWVALLCCEKGGRERGREIETSLAWGREHVCVETGQQAGMCPGTHSHRQPASTNNGSQLAAGSGQRSTDLLDQRG
jgi:hypothetical protein